jgi:hypothetical protein
MDALQSAFGQSRDALELALSQFDVRLAAIGAAIAAALLFMLSLILLLVRTDRLAGRVDTLAGIVDGLRRSEEARYFRELTRYAHHTKEQAGNGIAGGEEVRTTIAG